MARTRRRLKLGAAVHVLMFCEKCNYMWAHEGTVVERGISFGRVSAPGAADDPSVCEKCHTAEIRYAVM